MQPRSASERLARRYVYGEAHPQATTLNLRGRPYQVYDGAGVVTSQAYDFKGNLLQASRRLRSDVHGDADWSVLAALTDVAAIAAGAEPLLETESFGSQTAYDALNRPTSVTAPDASEVKPTYNEAGLLERIEARIRGAVTWTTFVDDIDYDTKGQRERIEYGNGTSTAYTYDPLTFRLSRLRTTRSSDSAVLQNLTYTYDPVGNIVEINDGAQQTVFFNDAVVSPSAQYVYDAVYRLIEATGREHAGGLADVQRDQSDLPIQSLPHANDAQALRNYTERYVYDAVGNILRMVHQAGTGTWTRRYAYQATSNRLVSTSTPGDLEDGHYSATYAHDAHGNMTAMPHIAALTWDENDQVRSTDLGGGGVVYYAYDAAGQRVRKVWEHSGIVEERIYLGGYEVYRRREGVARELVLERQTLHVMDGARRVAMVETKTVDTSGPFTKAPRIRYQLDNHLSSAVMELDDTGQVISCEEYHPYGTTSYHAVRSDVEVPARRYRYTGKECDEETRLYHHGVRYYAPWLGRWTSGDPIGIEGGINLFEYVVGNPIRLVDPTGTDPKTTYLGSSKEEKYVARLEKTWGGNQYWSESGAQGAGWYVQTDGRKIVPIRIGVTTVEHVRPEAKEATLPTCSIAPGRGGCPPGSVYEPPGRSSGSPADRLPDPVTKAVYKYLTEENPTTGAVVETIQALGSVTTLAMDARSLASALRSSLATPRVTNLGGDPTLPDAVRGAERAGREGTPFNPTGSLENCVKGVCAFLNSVKTGRLVQAGADYAENEGRISTALKQISLQTGACFGARQSNTLDTARDRQFFVVFSGTHPERSGHVAIGIVNRGAVRIYDPQTGERFRDIQDFGRFQAFPLVFTNADTSKSR